MSELAGPPAGETSARLIQTAVSSFAARGYASTSLNDVAQKAGLTTGAIYWNFSSKADLFLSATQYVEGRIEHAIALGQRPEFSLEARVCAYIDSISELAATEPEVLSFQAALAVEIRRHRDLKTLVGDEFGRRRELCRRVIGLVGDTGLGLSVDELAGLMLLATEGLAASATGQAPTSQPFHREEGALWKQLILGRLLVRAA